MKILYNSIFVTRLHFNLLFDRLIYLFLLLLILILFYRILDVTNSLTSSGSDSNELDFFINNIFTEVIKILKPVELQGHLDSLIGQRLGIELILLMMCCFILMLFVIFIYNLIILLNKDYLLNKFNNKYIQWYIKYQIFISRLAIIYLPIIIFVSLIFIFNGLYWLNTHQIPYHSLGIDLHQIVTPSNFVLKK